MSNENDGWETVTVPEDKQESTQVAFELEDDEQEEIVIEEEVQPEPVQEVQEEVVEEEKEEQPKELEGIETKGAEKRIRQLIRQRKEREEQIQKLMQQNEELQNNLKVKDNEVDSIATRSLNANEKQLTQNIELARQAYMEAFEDGDKEKVLKAQEILNNAQSDLKTVQNYKNNLATKLKQKEEQVAATPQPVQSQQPSYDPKANEWAERNEWFGKDTVKTAAALALDAELKEQGYDPNDEEFYGEIDRRLEMAFGQASNRVQETEEQSNSGTSQPAQVVSGASRSSPSAGKKVKLSKEDVRLANKWGIPLEQYAAEKLKVNQADGEYTNVNM
jgi:hypothetical protein|tara:strand:+ start:1132 stop:2130 length:999 start_codon:yes stop_codon:yes gene_type:complete